MLSVKQALWPTVLATCIEEDWTCSHLVLYPLS